MPVSKMSEKEQSEKMKALRREIEDKLEEQLPPEMLESAAKVEVQVIAGTEELDPAKARQVIESLLFAATKPLTVGEIRKVLKFMTPSQITGVIQELKTEYETQQRSFEIHDVANGFEVVTKKEFAPWIMRIELQKRARQVTQSALETLAILAYKQPITRAEIEDLRGVDVSGVLNTLMERDLIKIVGRKEVPGRPFMYGTTEKFLEHFGLQSIGGLPSIEEIKKMVEGAVNREELLGRPQVVEVPQSGETPLAEESAEILPESESPESEPPAQETAAWEIDSFRDVTAPVLGDSGPHPVIGDPV